MTYFYVCKGLAAPQAEFIMQSNYYVSDNDRFARAKSQRIGKSDVQLTRKLAYIGDKVDEIRVAGQAWTRKKCAVRRVNEHASRMQAEGHCGREIMSIVLPSCKSEYKMWYNNVDKNIHSIFFERFIIKSQYYWQILDNRHLQIPINAGETF